MANTTYSFGASYSIIWFFTITTIYSVIKFFTESKASKFMNEGQSETEFNEMNKNRFIFLSLYITLLFIGQFIINVSISKKLCNVVQWKSSLLITLIPWVFIFLVLCLLLLLNPGWLQPFSNTFGYLVAYLSGINGVINEIIKPDNSDKDADSGIKESLALIYSNRTLLINEITKDNFTDFWERIKPLMKDTAKTDTNLRDRLFRLVVMKETIAEFIWYILCGVLVCSIGYNYLVNTQCVNSIKDLELKMDEKQSQFLQKSRTTVRETD